MTTRVRPLFPLLLAFGIAFVAARADAQVAVSASVQIGDFRLAVSNYFRVPEREVVVIHDRRIGDDELPVVLFIAQRASVAPATVVDLRLRGMSWWQISTRFHIGPEVYYVPVSVAPGPPYGRAYGYYKRPRSQWHSIVLADADVVNMVHLRFLSDYYHVPPERVMESRGRNGSFVAVQHEFSSRGSAGRGGDDKKGDDAKGRDGKGKDDKKDPPSNGRGRGRGGL